MQTQHDPQPDPLWGQTHRHKRGVARVSPPRPRAHEHAHTRAAQGSVRLPSPHPISHPGLLPHLTPSHIHPTPSTTPSAGDVSPRTLVTVRSYIHARARVSVLVPLPVSAPSCIAVVHKPHDPLNSCSPSHNDTAAWHTLDAHGWSVESKFAHLHSKLRTYARCSFPYSSMPAHKRRLARAEFTWV